MQEVDDWFSISERDMLTAKYNLKGKKFDAALFFCHQSVEKAKQVVGWVKKQI